MNHFVLFILYFIPITLCFIFIPYSQNRVNKKHIPGLTLIIISIVFMGLLFLLKTPYFPILFSLGVSILLSGVIVLTTSYIKILKH
ncbi:hypothetical protein CHI10_15545 [Bacillus sp. 7894-2]|nr:hypothetical protein CHI10_15545 [Bacillus sp. 7894-2]